MSTTVKEPTLDDEIVSVPTAITSGREYVVLQHADKTENVWLELGIFPAGTTEQAIRDAAALQAADPDVDTSGVLTYVAVPARSFPAGRADRQGRTEDRVQVAMTWQWVVLILGVLAFVLGESYMNVLKERTGIAKESLRQFGEDAYKTGVSDLTETRLGNGNS